MKIVKKILLQSVGTGSERHPVWEALAFSVRERKPDLLVQFCSKQTEQETLPKFRDILSSQANLRDAEVIVSPDVDNVNELTKQYVLEITNRQKQFPEAQIEVDFTSGTKAMSVALALAGVICRVHGTLYSVGQRDDGGRASKTDYQHIMSTNDIIAEHQKLELIQLFNASNYQRVIDYCVQLRPITGTEVSDWLETLQKLAEVYQLWNGFQWREARAKVKELKERRPLVNSEDYQGTLTRHSDHLKICATSGFSFERCIDIFLAAQRSHRMGLYGEAVLRAYRAVEYIGQFRFAYLLNRPKNQTNSTGKVRVDDLPEHLRSRLLRSPMRNGWTGDKIDLGLKACLFALECLGDEYGKYAFHRYGVDDNRGPLQNALSCRNQSWLAHGDSVVKKSQSEKLIEELQRLLLKHFECPIKNMPTPDRPFAAYESAATFLMLQSSHF